MSLTEELDRELRELKSQRLLRTPMVVSGPQGPTIMLDGREVICLSSNNYLGLANHPDLIEAACETLRADGVGSGASRLINGTMEAHVEAEKRLAAMVNAPASLLFSTGYAANVGTITALIGEGDVVFSDELNHASLIDGCRISRAKVVVYPHGDADALTQLLVELRGSGRRALVVTDAVFSMDGDAAPLTSLRHICDAADAWLYVDEAHSLGVRGPSGRGLSAELEVRPDVLVGTLGKAFGVAGAFVASSKTAIRFLQNRARSYVFSTAPPPSMAAAAARAADLVESADEARATLRGHAERIRAALKDQGYDARGGSSAIVPVHIGDRDTTMHLSASLLERGVFAQGIRPPTVAPGTSRIRVVPMATHSTQQIEHAIEAFAEARVELEL